MTGGNGSHNVPEAAPAAPLFYKFPVALDAGKHAGKSLKTEPDFLFAAQANAISLAISEFSLAARHYPIVFIEADVISPVAVLGLRKDQNLFVGNTGQWAKDHYIPAYVRRYPFIFAESDDKKQLILCVDEGSGLLIDGDENPLYLDGAPSETLNKALELCKSFQDFHQLTIDFAAALGRAGLLVDQTADASLNSGEKMSLSGFKVVDEEKFNALDDKTFLEWRVKGWLPFVYFHLASMHNWGLLIDRSAEGENT